MMIDKKKALVFERQAEIAKAVAHPLRVAVIDFLKDGERCVCVRSRSIWLGAVERLTPSQRDGRRGRAQLP
jgi:DNA-binding transcriptional ArsR family regulator